jgi:hypothetical protein
MSLVWRITALSGDIVAHLVCRLSDCGKAARFATDRSAAEVRGTVRLCGGAQSLNYHRLACVARRTSSRFCHPATDHLKLQPYDSVSDCFFWRLCRRIPRDYHSVGPHVYSVYSTGTAVLQQGSPGNSGGSGHGVNFTYCCKHCDRIRHDQKGLGSAKRR